MPASLLVRRPGVISAVLAFALVLGAGPARADAKKDAQVLYDEGIRQMKAGDTKGALVSLRASYEKLPSFKVLYTIGQACVRISDGACAVRSYEQYLREGGKEIAAKRRKEVESEIRGLSQTLGKLTVKSTAIAADVSIDDVVVGKTPFSEPILVNGGAHKVVLVTKDKGTVEKTVNVLAGETATVHLDHKEEPAAPPPVAATPSSPAPEERKGAEPLPEAPPPDERRPFPTLAWGITGGLAAGTLVSGILAATSYSSYQDKKAEYPITRDDLESSQGTARDFFLLTAVLGTGTLIAAGVSTWLTFGPPPPVKHEKSRRLGLRELPINVGVGPRGVAVTGVFP